MLQKNMKQHTEITLLEVKKRCKRKNAEANNRLHWFSSKFSIYFSYFFLKMRFTADQVTFIFFFVGLIGSLLYAFNSLALSLIAYFFFRLHIIIDMSDGDVARFNKSFSIRGAYWDAVIHSILNPLYFVFISYSFFIQFNNNIFLILGAFMGVSSSVLMGVKNNYYKALFSNKISTSPIKSKKSVDKSIKDNLFALISNGASIEGFILITVLVRFVDKEVFAIVLLIGYLILNIVISIVKFYLLSFKGYYEGRN